MQTLICFKKTKFTTVTSVNDKLINSLLEACHTKRGLEPSENSVMQICHTQAATRHCAIC